MAQIWLGKKREKNEEGGEGEGEGEKRKKKNTKDTQRPQCGGGGGATVTGEPSGRCRDLRAEGPVLTSQVRPV